MSTKILIVEDSNIISEHYTKKLSLLGYSIKQSFDGVDALKLIRNFKPNIVLLDDDIPKKTGMEVLRDIKNNPKTKHICVIMFTVWGFNDEMKQAKELGVDEFIRKPIKPNEMIKIIEKQAKKIIKRS